MVENDLTYRIRGCIFKVYNNLGPGLFESVYEAALLYELKKEGLKAESQVDLAVEYDGFDLGLGFRIDVLVEDEVIVEIKSVEKLAKVHYKQVITYLKVSHCPLGVLVNFNTDNIVEDTKRIVNNYIKK